MIHTPRQYQQTQLKRQEFIAALDALRAQRHDSNLKRTLHEHALLSQIEAFDREIGRYDALTRGEVTFPPLGLIEQLPELLTELRLAAHLTHRALGDLVGVHEEQIRRYEATDYRSASLTRVLMIFEACRAHIQEQPVVFSADWTSEPPVQPPPEFFAPDTHAA